jgi:hypothetical protein
MMMLACTKCGHKRQEANAKLFSGKVIEHNPKQFVAVIGKDRN